MYSFQSTRICSCPIYTSPHPLQPFLPCRHSYLKFSNVLFSFQRVQIIWKNLHFFFTYFAPGSPQRFLESLPLTEQIVTDLIYIRDLFQRTRFWCFFQEWGQAVYCRWHLHVFPVIERQNHHKIIEVTTLDMFHWLFILWNNLKWTCLVIPKGLFFFFYKL